MTMFKSLLIETGAEILKVARAPEYIIPTLLFPVAFYFMFGVVLSGTSNNASYLLATYGVFAVMGPAIFGFGVSTATEKGKGWLTLKRAAPARAVNYIAAKVITTVIFATMAVALLYMVGGFVAGVELSRETWALLLLTHMLATLPFILIGLTLGFLLNANAAIAFANIVFMGLAILGGLWIPIFVFPDTMQSIAKALPTYYLGEIALAVSGQPPSPGQGAREIGGHITMVIYMTIGLTALTVFAWTRQRN